MAHGSCCPACRRAAFAVCLSLVDCFSQMEADRPRASFAAAMGAAASRTSRYPISSVVSFAPSGGPGAAWSPGAWPLDDLPGAGGDGEWKKAPPGLRGGALEAGRGAPKQQPHARGRSLTRAPRASRADDGARTGSVGAPANDSLPCCLLLASLGARANPLLTPPTFYFE